MAHSSGIGVSIVKPIVIGSIMFAVGAAAGIGGALFYSSYGSDDSAGSGNVNEEREALPSPKSVVAMGKLLPASGMLSIGGQPGDRVEVMHVSEGDRVAKGDPLADLLSYDLRDIEVQAIQFQIDDANKKQTIEAKAASFQEKKATLGVTHATNQKKLLDGAEQKIGLLRKQHELEASQLKRLEDLRSESPRLVTESQLAKQGLLVDKLAIDVESAELELKNSTVAAESALESAKQDLDAAKERVALIGDSDLIKALEEQKKAAILQRDQSKLESPIDGVVMKILTAEGDTIARLPVLQVANLANIQCVADVFESQRQWVKENQKVTLFSKALTDVKGVPLELTGKVIRVGTTIGTPGTASPDPFAPSDSRTVTVVIEIDETWRDVIRDYVNLQVEVRIETDELEASESVKPVAQQSVADRPTRVAS